MAGGNSTVQYVAWHILQLLREISHLIAKANKELISIYFKLPYKLMIFKKKRVSHVPKPTILIRLSVLRLLEI